MSSPTSPKVETQRIELNTAQCIRVALYMYEEWEKTMKPCPKIKL